MKQFLAFVRKEFYHVFRDPKTMLLLFGLPIVQIVLFGFALTTEIKNTNIVISDYAHDPASKRITDMLQVSQNFDIKNALLTHDQIENAFKEGDIKLAIVFPAHFNDDLLHFNHAQVQVYCRCIGPQLTATSLTAFASSINMNYQKETPGKPGYPLPGQY
jgi:ABC-2 type transport system permease protein